MFTRLSFRVLLISIVVPLVAAVALSGCDDGKASAKAAQPEVAAQPEAVPAVVGEQLDESLKALGDFDKNAKVTIADVVSDRNIIVKSNWVVVSQDPAAGSVHAQGGAIHLGVRKLSDAASAEATQPAPSVTTTAAPAVVVSTTTTAVPATTTTVRETSTVPPAAPVGGSVNYANCDAAKRAGAAPLHRGDPGYSSNLDRDHDGIACE